MIGHVPGFEDDLRARFGDAVRLDGLARAVFSTDASNYRVPPRAVVQPRSRDDVVDAVALATAHGVPVTPRGGGTSCAGNAIGPGLVLDLSRHLRRVLAVDPEAGPPPSSPGWCSPTCRRPPHRTACASAPTRPPRPGPRSAG